MRIFFFATSALALALASTSPATAKCRTTPFRFAFGQSAPTPASTEVDATGCHHRFRAGGRSIFTSASIVTPPRHGTLKQPEHFGFFYAPVAGFAGIDTYSVKVCGQSLGDGGCAVIDYTAEVK